MKYWIGRIHLWLGLASGLVVLLVSLTGCLFVFQQEVSDGWYKDRFFVTPSTTALPLSTLLTHARAALGTPVNNVTTYADPARAWEFMSYKENPDALTYFGTLVYYRSVFIDPHTGRITGSRDYKHDFFFLVKYLHWSLLLNTRYGQPIVGWSTIVFVVLLLTGLVLWWPKRWTRAARRQSFSIKWGARFKRLNYDLHNVLGFYVLLLALVMALTGLVFAFGWMSRWVGAIGREHVVAAPRAQAVAAAGTPVHAAQTTAAIVDPGATMTLNSNAAPDPLDAAFARAKTLLPDARRIGLTPPGDRDSTIAINGYRGCRTYYDRDDLLFDRRTGRLLKRINFIERTVGDKLLNMNYDIHVGAIGGLVGKLLAFIISLVCASLPVTGFLVWWGKKRKRPRATSPPAARGPNRYSSITSQ
ncbi:PepSY-associated TM helix domain-containing protein [Dinghuibacter silviterrae]|uniref:Putative iron-regulated membrane protein n=1 Tax=Dinghuibacter silviterrae TaxID=1539049 RepID=A0A4R8DUI4_9BACT|nr:PepSY-associated TM helix domain-containing protein [Dinghuibacter silviterrae]TDX01586.1 putative iron-regulated membrane protein [Dinghuibacter silviterrae]